MSRIGIVIPYFGSLPPLAAYFFESVGHARDVDVLFFTDTRLLPPVPRNVKVYSSSVAEFNDLASRAIGAQVRVDVPQKLCDLKPAYAAIFNDYLRGYEFWGFGDIDLVCGDLARFLEPLLADHDVVSCRRGWISGSLCLFRNSGRVNCAYAHSTDWHTVLTSPDCQLFDELGGHLHNAVLGGADLRVLKGNVESFTHVVKRLQDSGELRCAFEDLACEDLPWGEALLYNDGRITRCQDGSDVMYVHTVLMKRRFFHVPNVARVPQRFYIRKSGIYTEHQYARMMHLREAARVFRGGASGLSRLVDRWI